MRFAFRRLVAKFQDAVKAVVKSDDGMTPERWRKIGELFDLALERDPAERRAFLESACGEDAALRDEVLRLIQHHEATGSLLDRPALPRDVRPDERLGQTLRHFRILEPVGRGGQGQVYLAEDLRLNRQVALKLLPEEMQSDAAARKRLLREAQSAARLDHPFACSIFEVGEEKGASFVAMELVRGETLRRRLARDKPSMPEALKWGLEIAEALDAAHRLGLVHRDLKPSNLMITQSGHIKVMDFGLAKRVILEGDAVDASLAESLSEQGTAVGTIAYMSPEQLRGEPLDARSDVFALGLILFELLSGVHPFARGSPMETASAILHDPAPPLSEAVPDCPPLLDSTVAEMLASQKSRRLPSARIVAERLSLLLRTSPESAGKPIEAEVSAGGRLSAWTKWAAVGLAALLAIGFLTDWILQALVFRPSQPTRVAVLSPAVSGSADPALMESISFAVLEASLNGLTGLREIEAFDPSHFGSAAAGPAEVEKEMATDEVLESRISCNVQDCRISLRRLRHSRIVKVSPMLAWSARPEDTLSGADAVEASLLRLYSEFDSGGSRLEVEPEDYRRYLLIKQKQNQGVVLDETELEELENMGNTSPRWLPAYLLAAEAARALNRVNRGLGALRQAENFFEDDPRLLYARFQLEASSDRLEEAEKTLSSLEETLPGDERTLKARRLLLRKKGMLAEALQLAGGIAERWPSWRNLWDLATLERRMGRMENARLHLRQLLDRSPDNSYGLSALAGLETNHGDLSVAEELYRRLAAIKPLPEDLGSLCLVLYLAGRYPEAILHCEQALDLQPENDLPIVFNLALAAGAAGQVDRARNLFDRLHRRLGGDDRSKKLDPVWCIIKAHCLARLGRPAEAQEWIQNASTPEPEAWVVYETALVYALIHPQVEREREIVRAKVLTNTEAALENGYARHWFEVPAFEPFRRDPGFQALLSSR